MIHNNCHKDFMLLTELAIHCAGMPEKEPEAKHNSDENMGSPVRRVFSRIPASFSELIERESS